MNETNAYYKNKLYNKINRTRRDNILSLIKDGSKVLDIGCGDGALGVILKNEKKCSVVGIDISDEAVALSKEKLDQAFNYDVTGNEEWPESISQQSFGSIVLSEVLEHIFYPENVLKKLKGIMHQDTEIVITVPNLLFWKNRLNILRGNFTYTDKGLMDRGHIHFFSWESFKKTISDSGFVIAEKKHHVPTRGTKWLSKKFPGLFAYQFIVKIKQR